MHKHIPTGIYVLLRNILLVFIVMVCISIISNAISLLLNNQL